MDTGPRETLHATVTITGQLADDSYTKDGERRRGIKLEAADIAASLRNTAVSQAASPPSATAIASSATIFPGSCVPSGRRHGRNSRVS
jgi:hypothetical protein